MQSSQHGNESKTGGGTFLRIIVQKFKVWNFPYQFYHGVDDTRTICDPEVLECVSLRLPKHLKAVVEAVIFQHHLLVELPRDFCVLLYLIQVVLPGMCIVVNDCCENAGEKQSPVGAVGEQAIVVEHCAQAAEYIRSMTGVVIGIGLISARHPRTRSIHHQIIDAGRCDAASEQKQLC